MSRRRGEFELIAELLAPLAAEGAFGLTDDAALLPAAPDGMAWVATKDAMVCARHFLPGDPPDLVARKLLRVNLSDLAAMGARPQGYLMSTAWPDDIADSWITTFVDGLSADQQTYGIGLYGGDTVSTPGPMTLTVTALGLVPRDGVLRRNGARTGDDIWVSGTLGASALGLRVLYGQLSLEPEMAEALVLSYRLPQPRVELGPALIGIASACMDISDGLVADLGHIAEASGVGARIAMEDLPLSPLVRACLTDHPELARLPLSGGDDYELLFTAPPGDRNRVAEVAEQAATTVRRIGQVLDRSELSGDAAVEVTAAGRPLPAGPAGWRHF